MPTLPYSISRGPVAKYRNLALGLAICAASLLLTRPIGAVQFEQMQKQFLERFGPRRLAVLKDWRTLMLEAKTLADAEKLARINAFVNKRTEFSDDLAIWAQSDYWATPAETIGQGRGDCEDFVIFKYFSLIDAGIPVAKLRLVYVKAKLNGPNGPYLQAHMVLAYYPGPNSIPLVLDNLVTDIKPATQRGDLVPMFSFNSEAIWQGVAENAAKGTGGTGQLSRWQELLERAHQEGFQ